MIKYNYDHCSELNFNTDVNIDSENLDLLLQIY